MLLGRRVALGPVLLVGGSMNWSERLANRVEQLLRERVRARQEQVAPPQAPAPATAGREPAPQPMSGPVLHYTETLIDHFVNPRNVGEMAVGEADGYALIGDPGCGDQMKLWIRVDHERITAIRFRSFGCPGAIATSSMATELALGRSLAEALDLTDDDVIAALGGIPQNKRHCSLLGINALHGAVVDYLEKAPADGARSAARSL
jgi:nitrogen fixation protein NifU and related proteins